MSTTTVDQALRLYINSLGARGVHASSVLTAGRVLRSFFRPALGEPVADLYPELARQLADTLGDRISKHTGRPLARRTCRNYRVQARLFLQWCAALGCIPHNPLEPSGADPAAPEQR